MGEAVKRKVDIIMQVLGVNDVKNKIGGVQSAWNRLAGGIRSAQRSIVNAMIGTGGVVWAFKALGDAIIRPSMDAERFMVSLKVLYKDAGVASDMFKWALQFARETPFILPEVIQGMINMKSFGMDVTKWFTLAGDLASGMRVPLEQVIDAVGKLQSGLSGIGVRQLQYVGISREMWKQVGITFTRRGQAQATAKEMLDALEIMIKQRFGGMMAAQSKTLYGILNNLYDVFWQFRLKLGDKVFGALKKDLDSLLHKLWGMMASGKLDQIAKNIGSKVQQAYNWLITKLPNIIDKLQIIVNLAWPFIEKVAGNIDKVFILAVTLKMISLVKELAAAFKDLAAIKVFGVALGNLNVALILGTIVSLYSIDKIFDKKMELAKESTLKKVQAEKYSDVWLRGQIERMRFTQPGREIDEDRLFEEMLPQMRAMRKLEISDPMGGDKIAKMYADTIFNRVGISNLPQFSKETDDASRIESESNRLKREEELIKLERDFELATASETAAKKLNIEYEYEDKLHKLRNDSLLSDTDIAAWEIKLNEEKNRELTKFETDRVAYVTDTLLEYERDAKLAAVSEAEEKRLQIEYDVADKLKKIYSDDALSFYDKTVAKVYIAEWGASKLIDFNEEYFNDYMRHIRKKMDTDEKDAAKEKKDLEDKIKNSTKFKVFETASYALMAGIEADYVNQHIGFQKAMAMAAIDAVKAGFDAYIDATYQKLVIEAAVAGALGNWASTARLMAIAAGLGTIKAIVGAGLEVIKSDIMTDNEEESSSTSTSTSGGSNPKSNTYGGTVRSVPYNVVISPSVSITGDTIFIGQGSVRDLTEAIGDTAVASVKQAIDDGEIDLSKF